MAETPETVTIKITCNQCGKFLGTYQGEPFWITAQAESDPDIQTLCKQCWNSKESLADQLVDNEASVKQESHTIYGWECQKENNP